MHCYYDHTGHRVLKKRKDGIMVYNINRLYELAVIPSEGERHTIYIYGQQGEMVAQRTINDATLLAANQRRAYSRALAKWADDGTLVGSVQAGYFLLGPELTDKENLTDALKIIFILLVLFGLGYWGLSHYREGTEEQNKPFLQVNAFLVSLSVLYAFSFFRCGVNAPVLNGTEWTDEVVAIPPEVPGVEDPVNDPTNHDGPQDPNQPAPIASFPVEGIYFYHQDHLGSPALITNGAGVVVTVLAYKPYGELDLDRSSGPDIIRYKYTLQEQDVETGLYNYRARYYGAASGSFTSADSLVPNSKDAGSYNRYGYVKGNPLKYVDPTGHSWSGFWKGLKKVARGIAYAAMAAGLAAAMVMGTGFLLTAGLSLLPVLSISGGVASSVLTGFTVAANIAGTIAGINGFVAGWNDMYSHDWKGVLAGLADSTWALPTTAVGLSYMLGLKLSGYNMNEYYTEESNAYFMVKKDEARSGVSSLVLGNTIGTTYNSEYRKNNPEDFKRHLRHELAHPWHYRATGILGLTWFGLVEAPWGRHGLKLYDNYEKNWTLEGNAVYNSELPNENRPWFLNGEQYDKFY